MPAPEKVGVQLEVKDYQKFVSHLTAADKALRTFTTTFTTSMLQAQRAAQATKITDVFKDMQRELATLSKSAIMKRAAGFPEFVSEIEKQAERLQRLTQERLGALGIGMDKMIFANMGRLRKEYAKFFEETGLGARVWGEEVTEAYEQVQAQQVQLAKSTEGTTKKTTSEFSSALTEIAQRGEMLPGVLGKTSGAVAGLSKAFAAGTVGAAALGTGIGIALVTALAAALKITGKVISKIKELGVAFAKTAVSIIEQAATLGGRFTEMELAAVAVGRGVGIADETILRAIKSVNAMNIRYDVAAASVLRMARVQIDLKYATDLVRVAQAIAIETGRESSEEMTSLTHALTTNNVQMLRRHGIIIDNEVAERRYAEANDLVAKGLTARQKIEAQVQAVIRESAHLMGVYEAAMQSGAKLMRSIESRLIPEFLAALGAPMQGAYSAVTKAIYDFLTALNASITEGGRFYPTMVKIGAVLQIVGEHLADFTRNLTSFFRVQVSNIEELEATMGMVDVIDEAADEMNQSLSDMAVAAFEWGAEIMAQFAQGLAAGLRFVGEAMLLVAQTLSYWLSTFSPPRVAPNIAKWGAAAMAEYLRGFSMVDFGAFEGIQKVLGRLLSGPKLAGLLGQIIESMALGTVGEDLFDRIAAATGAFGAEIVKLTKLQFQYAEALRAVEAAQLALTRAQEAVKGHSLEVDKLVREYNKLLRAGASDEILDTKLAEINMSERARNAAIIERDEAQVSVRLAEERLDPIKEALALQEKLVDVLLDLAEAQADVVEETKKAAKGAADEILEEFAAVGAGIGGSIRTGMQKAIDAIKEDIAARLKDIFRPVWEAWFGIERDISASTGRPGWWDQERPISVVQAFEGVREAFGPLSEALGEFVALVQEKGLTEVLGSLPEPFGAIARALEAVNWDNLVKALNALTDAIIWLRENEVLRALIAPTEQDVEMARLGQQLYGGGGQQMGFPFLEWLWPSGGGAAAGAGGRAPGLQSMVQQDIGAGGAGGIIAGILASLGTTSGASVLNAILGFFRDTVLGGEQAPNMHPIGVSIDTGVSAGMLLPDAMNTIFASMQTIADEMLAAAAPGAEGELANTLWDVGRAFNVLIAKGIKDNVGLIINAMDEAMRRAREAISQLGHESAWPGGAGGDSLQQGGYSPRGGVHHAGEYVIPAGLTRALMQPVSHTANYTFNNNISQRIDEEYFMARVRNMIRREMSRA